MKDQLKLLVLFTAFFLLMSISPGMTKAAYDYTNLSCTNHAGRDIIFVIQDTPGMQTQDSESSRITEVSTFMDAANSQDRFGVIGFNTGITKNLGLTNNKITAKNTLQTFRTNPSPIEGNDLSVALDQAVDEMVKKSTSREKIIVVMTVGVAINNEQSIKLAEKAYEEDITIHAISFGDLGNVDVNTLTQIATMTGGDFKLSPNAAFLRGLLVDLGKSTPQNLARTFVSDFTLQKDETIFGNALISEGVKVDLNGYDLTVTGTLYVQQCSEVRVVNGVLTAKDIEQQSRSVIRLNTSQLHVTNTFTQDGAVIVNEDYLKSSAPELKINQYTQKIHGYLELGGQVVEVAQHFVQEGLVNVNKGIIKVNGNAEQHGDFNVQGGQFIINGNLTVSGGPLVDDAFLENKSLDVGGGLVQVGVEDGTTRLLKQESGQLFVNNGTVEVFGDYTISDGWLTMIKGDMDTTSPNYGPGDGDYVHVHGDFSMASPRNHAERYLLYLGNPMSDPAHLTHGVLRVDGNFSQIGNVEFNASYNDRFYNYTNNFSRYNFHAVGKHKVYLTGRGTVRVAGAGFKFNILEVEGGLGDYTLSGPSYYHQLIENKKSSNANLASLSINDIKIPGFTPNNTKYNNIEVPAGSFTGSVPTLKVDARAQDNNATVQVLDTVIKNNAATVEIIVTAHDGTTQRRYTIEVEVGEGSSGAVTDIKLDRDEIVFNDDTSGGFKPEQVTLSYTVYPNNAKNQKVTWTSTDRSVVDVSPNGIVTPIGFGEAAIMITTDDGGFQDTVSVQVLQQLDLLEGIKTLADLVSDQDRFNKIMSGLYGSTQLGIIVPGDYIKSIEFTNLLISPTGTITTNPSASPKVASVYVRVNGQQLGTIPMTPNEEFQFIRRGLTVGDAIEVIAYDQTGNELERVTQNYPVKYTAGSQFRPGFYTFDQLLRDPITFDAILDNFAPEQLKFAY